MVSTLIFICSQVIYLPSDYFTPTRVTLPEFQRKKYGSQELAWQIRKNFTYESMFEVS